MWGADYPHSEGSYPYTTEALRVAFAEYAEPDVRAMVESTAASFYGFDLGVLRPIGDRVGPLVAEVGAAAGTRGLADQDDVQRIRPHADPACLVTREGTCRR